MKIRPKNKVSTEFNMAAMTDLVFLLLIFFMLMSTLITNSNVINMTIPKSTSKEKQAGKAVKVSLNRDLQYFVDGTPVEKEMISDILKAKLGDAPDGKVEVAVDEEVPHKYFVELADIISVQNHYKMLMVTLPKETAQ